MRHLMLAFTCIKYAKMRSICGRGGIVRRSWSRWRVVKRLR